MPIKAVIWDIGGVINRTKDLAPRDALASDLRVTHEQLNYLFFSGPQGTRAQKGEITTAELMASVREELNLDGDQYPDLLERFFGGDVIDHSLVDFIRTLKPAIKTGIISNAWSELSGVLEEWGIADAFDFVVGSGDVGIMKPDPQIYHLALKGLEVQPEEAVFIDDFIENIRGAQELGIKAIHFQNRSQTLEALERLLDLD